jgi:hypothetical protein
MWMLSSLRFSRLAEDGRVVFGGRAGRADLLQVDVPAGTAVSIIWPLESSWPVGAKYPIAPENN